MRNVINQLILFLYITPSNDVYAQAAKNILKNLDKVKDCSITELADLCYVSAATISRLCRKLNFESFYDFKQQCAQSDDTFKNMYFPTFDEAKQNEESMEEIASQHYNAVIQTIQYAYENIEIDKINQIVDLVHDSKQTIFVGYYLATLNAIQFQIELTGLGKVCCGSLDIKEQVELIKNSTENDVIILTSLSGAFLRSNNGVIRWLKRTKAKKVLLSYAPALEEHVDIFINTFGKEDSLISKFTLTYIYELIEMIYRLKYGNESIITNKK